jgi:hypothetical protein
METAPRIRLVLWKTAKAIEKVDQASIAETGLHLFISVERHTAVLF